MTAPMPLRLWPCLLVLACGPAPRTPHLTWEPQTSGVTVRLRGLSAVSARVAWASGAGGTVLRTTDGGATWQARPVPGAAALDFRDVDAASAQVAYALSIGPGESSRIYKTQDGGDHWDVQFTNTDPQVFLDAMAFWDADRGVAVSDSVAGAFVILTTTDGGRDWTRVPADRLPAALRGEGAFAASGTNVATSGPNDVWIGTGRSRVLHSVDGGRSWTIGGTPLPSGESSGIFSIAFRDRAHGVVVGGDYRRDTEAINNAAVTADGGASWLLPARGLGGYRSVVAHVPAAAHAFVAAGPSGIDLSVDDGQTWMPASTTGVDAVSFAAGAATGWGAGDHGRLGKLVFQE
ncbi:MAG: hypothetical protein V7647_3132 [Acidobacteriota bacterium]|jgi:photosystem II stability/assembly factor-like uncharacterized protein